MTTKKPHRPYASGDMRKEELTKRLCSLVDNSQDSCKKVPSAKNAPTEQSSERPMGVTGKGPRNGMRAFFASLVQLIVLLLFAVLDAQLIG